MQGKSDERKQNLKQEKNTSVKTRQKYLKEKYYSK